MADNPFARYAASAPVAAPPAAAPAPNPFGGYTVGILPLVINIALVGFEILVAMLQAYVFTILTCLYIRDALELH